MDVAGGHSFQSYQLATTSKLIPMGTSTTEAEPATWGSIDTSTCDTVPQGYAGLHRGTVYASRNMMRELQFATNLYISFLDHQDILQIKCHHVLHQVLKSYFALPPHLCPSLCRITNQQLHLRKRAHTRTHKHTQRHTRTYTKTHTQIHTLEASI